MPRAFAMCSPCLLSDCQAAMTTPEMILETASPEVKRYQRLKISALLAGTVGGVVWITIVALGIGPPLGHWLSQHLDGNNWLVLAVMAAFLGTTFEIFNLPLDLWSGFIVEHRYQLSNQTLGGCLWRRL